MPQIQPTLTNRSNAKVPVFHAPAPESKTKATATVVIAAVLAPIVPLTIWVTKRIAEATLPPTWNLAAMVTSFLLAATIYVTGSVFVAAKVRGIRAFMNTTPRLKRLIRLCRNDEFRARFPHRVVEWTRRAAHGNRKRSTMLAAGSASPWRIALVDMPSRNHFGLLDAVLAPFEPIPIDEVDPRIEQIIKHGVAEPDSATKISDAQPNLSRWQVVREMLNVANIIWLIALLACLFTVGMGIADAATGESFWCISSIAGIVLVIAAARILDAFTGVAWYVVPGGLVMRLRRGWRAVDQWQLISAEQSALIIDFLYDRVIVRSDRGIECITCYDESAIHLIAIAWRNPTMLPDKKQIEGFINGNK